MTKLTRLLLTLALLAVIATAWSIDPQTNPHRDAGAVRRANNGSDFLDAATVRTNLDVPSNAESIASLPNNASFTYDGLGGYGTAGTNGIPANASFTFAGLTGNPTTITGFGITDAASTALVVATMSGALTEHLASSSDPHGTNLTQTNASMTRLDVSGNIGVGGDPVTKLDVRGSSSDFNIGIFRLSSTDPVASASGGFVTFAGKYSGDTLADWAGVGGFKDNATADEYGGHLRFFTRANGGNNTERMRIDSSGNVGIGTSTIPSIARLTLAGDVGGYGFAMTGTHSGLGGDVRYISGAGTTQTLYYNARTGGGHTFAINESAKMAIEDDGDVTIASYTALGADAPKIKMKKLTGTMPEAVSSYTFMPHGLTASKILSIDGVVTDGAPVTFSPSRGIVDPAYAFGFAANATDLYCYTGASSGDSIKGEAVEVLITYEE